VILARNIGYEMPSGHDAPMTTNIGWKTLSDHYTILAKNIGYNMFVGY
jgi:hypothetical protein